MRPKTLLVMFGLIAVLGAFIVFYEKELPSTDERVELEKKVLGIEGDEVSALTISWDGQKVRLERQEPAAEKNLEEAAEEAAVGLTPQAVWRLVEPFAARADGAEVERLITSLVGLEHQRVLAEVDREAAGLTSPALRVTLDTEEGASELLFGAEIPASSTRIAGLTGREDAYVVDSALVDDLKKEPGAWRDKKLFTETRGEIERVTLEQAGERLILARRGEDFWVESPFVDQADGEAVNTLLSAVTGLTVTTFLDQPLLDPGAIGLEPAASVLEVKLQGREQPFRLELGESVDGEGVRYGRAEGELFELDAGLASSFSTLPGAWRSRDWAALQVFQINSATFTDAAGTTTIRRQEAEWLRGEDKIDYTIASDLLYAVAEAKAERVLDITGALAAPDLTVLLATEDREETLYLYTTDEGAMASREGREAILALSVEAAEEVRAKLEAVRDVEVLVEEEGEGEDES